MKRGMKSLLVLAVFGCIFLIGIVSAGSCLDNDRIMKLYNSTNSHGALWNDADYNWDICCEDIFGVGAGECNGVHTCSGTNKILGLYQANNSHAEIPSLDNYIYDVCYGNLICEAKIDPDPCSTYYEIIVRLYQNTNSHISNASNTNYPIKICCKAGVEITGAYWANMKEETITNVDLNDRVKLMVAGEGMENKEIDYTIYKSIPFWFDSKQAEDDVTGFTSWRASEAGTYYFIADVEGVNMQSGDLVVSATENNFPSVVNIVGPKTGDIFYIGEQMSFTQTSYDKDDEINLLWDLGDDTTSSEPSLTHPYSTIGQKTIKLTATDERGLAVIDRIAILIINPAGTKYVFAHIDEPEWGETLFGDLARVVEFNASSTYAVETSGCAGAGCTTDCCTIACLGGACHALTHEGGQGINANGMVGNYAPLNFSWTFDDGNWKNASGMDGVIFDWVFRTAGKHKAWLTTSTNPFSSTEVEFSGFFDYPYCYRDKLTDNTFWYEPDGSVILSLNDCYRALALNPKPSTDCCPPSYACNTGLGICEQLEGIASCSQYSEEKCGSNVFVAEDELNPILEKNGYKCGGSSKYGTNCWEIVDCKCGFENQKCLAIAEHWICNETVCWDYTNLPGNIQTICDATTSPYSGQCSFSFDLLDECETSGFIKRTWAAAWIEQAPIPAYCADGSDQIPCKVTKLVFWKITGLIAAVLLIIIIYWFIIKKGKRKGKGERK